MSVRRIVMLNIVALLVLLGVAWGGWNWYYQRTHFVTTNDATVQGNQYPLHVEFPGKLTNWTVSNGDTVSAGQTIGKEDTSIELQQLGSAAKNKTVAQSVSDAANITSPINGSIIQANAKQGQTVAPGQPLGYVVNLKKLFIVANIKETELQHVAVGDSVDISIDAFPNTSFKGTVTSIGLATNSTFSLLPSSSGTSGTYTKVTQTVPVEISMSGYGGDALVPGMSATVHIHRQNN